MRKVLCWLGFHNFGPVYNVTVVDYTITEVKPFRVCRDCEVRKSYREVRAFIA